MKKLLVDVQRDYIQAVQIDGKGLMCDYFALLRSSPLGDVYAGRVENARGEQYFINYGAEKNGILTERNAALKVGELIKCRVIREEFGDKGVILSREILLGGYRVIAGNGITGLNFSKKLSAEMRRRYNPLDFKNCIIRSYAAGFPTEDTLEEYRELSEELNRITETRADKPKPLYVENALRKLLKEFDLADTHILYSDAGSGSRFTGELEKCGCTYEIYGETVAIFDKFGVRDAVERLFSRRVEKNGVEIVFDGTEAMTVIDVNSKGATGLPVQEINRRAAEEIHRQICLRNIGGVILADFVSGSAAGAEDTAEYLRNLFAGDREKVKIAVLNELFIIAINRKKRYNSINNIFYRACGCCGGEGTERVYPSIGDAVRRLYAESRFDSLTAEINPLYVKEFIAEYDYTLKNVMPRLKIFIEENERLKSFSLSIGRKENAKPLDFFRN